jgi:hypothetical protein
MSSPTEVSLKVNLVHGEQLIFTVEQDEKQLRNAGNNIENGMKSNYLGVEHGKRDAHSQAAVVKSHGGERWVTRQLLPC